jgi:exopolysaccharide biosynthesis operon protein EpsL
MPGTTATRFSKAVGALALAVGALAPFGSAFALFNDQVEIFASETVTYDSNLFRISNGRDPLTFIGNSKKDDVFYTTSVGINVNVPFERQRILAGFAINDTRYERFSGLNFTGHEMRGSWLYQIGNDLSGQVGFAQTRTLGSFTNIAGATRNIIDTQQAFANAAYMLGARWRLTGGVDRYQADNSDAARREQDVTVTGAEFGVAYVTPAESSIGVTLREDNGEFPNRQVLPGGPFDNSYRQRSGNLVFDWNPSPQSHLNARAGRVYRNYDQLSQRNFEGTVWRVQYDWRPTVKLTIAAIAQRDISAFEDIATSFVLARGFGLRPSWAVTEKTTISGVLEWSRRTYLGDPGLVTGATAGRTDRVTTTGISAAWQALRNVSVVLTAQRERRTSTAVFGDYTDNLLSARARIGF